MTAAYRTQRIARDCLSENRLSPLVNGAGSPRIDDLLVHEPGLQQSPFLRLGRVILLLGAVQVIPFSLKLDIIALG